MAITRKRSSNNSKKKKKIAIPVIPFDDYEVHALVNREASEDLINRLSVWKASNDYAFISSLENAIIRDHDGGGNKQLSNQEKELRKQYIDWLAVGIESEKFKALQDVSLKGVSLDRDIKDTLVHSGIL